MRFTPFQGQEYEALKSAAVESGQLFEDPKFPAEESSLFYTAGKGAAIEWKRPKEICEDPKLFVEGSSSGDVSQGTESVISQVWCGEIRK